LSTAEGIEDVKQAAALQDLGCDVGQGFLFARPVPAEELKAVVKSHKQPFLAIV
jgi:diguanylate cyclase